jgi:hypothetical protein
MKQKVGNSVMAISIPFQMAIIFVIFVDVVFWFEAKFEAAQIKDNVLLNIAWNMKRVPIFVDPIASVQDFKYLLIIDALEFLSQHFVDTEVHQALISQV